MLKDNCRYIKGEHATPPKLAELLLCLCLPPLAQQSAIGDLEEEYQEQTQANPSTAGAWYWKQALSLSFSYIGERLKQFSLFALFAKLRRGGRRPEKLDWREGALKTLLQDLRYGLRALARRPGFTIVAALTMALGIGANTAIFSLVNGVLLKPLPYPEPDRLVKVWGTNMERGRDRANISVPNLLDLREGNDVFEQLAGYADDTATLTGRGEPEQVEIVRITEDFFQALGVQPAMGRFFVPDEHRAGKNYVAVLSHGFWQRRFGASEKISGEGLTLDGDQYIIAGILPPNDLQFPSRSADLWVPLAADGPDSSRGSRFLNAIARLKPDVSITQAQAEVTAISDRLEQEYPEPNAGIGVRLEPLREAIVGDSRPLLLILFLTVGFVLLIACANVANLLLFRVSERRKEIAIRFALGASRLRVVRQFLAESVLLSIFGGAIGLLIAWWGTGFLVALKIEDMPRQEEVGIDVWALVFTFAISVIPGLIIGLAPALQAARSDLTEHLKEGRGSITGAGRQWGRSALVVSEVALSLVLVIGAGLLMKSFYLLQKADPGFKPDGVLTLSLSLPHYRYPDSQRALAFYQEVTERLSALPGVQSAGAVSMLPLSGHNLCNEVTLEGHVVDGLECVECRSITPDYFHAIGIPLIKGRLFAERDDMGAPQVAIINKTMSRSLEGVEDSIGRQFMFRGKMREVIGIVEDVKHFGLDKEATPEAYLPQRQSPFPFTTIVLRTEADPSGIAAAAQREIRSVDKDLPIAGVETMEQIVSNSIAQPRIRALVTGSFSALALLLAMLGLYGVISYSVSRRAHEIGIRMALGAGRGDVLKLVLRQGLGLTLIGLVLGLTGAFIVTRVLARFLFGVGATDPALFAGVSILSVVVALAASYIPARRATRVDPVIALRYE